MEQKYKVVIAFALVYFFWGSTYLAISIAVHRIPPEATTSIRFFTAGLLMLLWCAWRGRRVRLRGWQAARLAVIGILLLSLGNTGVSASELYLPSGLAALIVAGIPLWFLIIEVAFVRRQQVTARAVAGLLLGGVGIVVLLWPQLAGATGPQRSQLWASLGLLGASMAWATGSVLSSEWQAELDPFVASAWEMTFAGALNMLISLLTGAYSRAQWGAAGLGAVGYLIVFGSWVGFSAYIWLLQNVPTSKVATYAYVNPVVAVFLGWLILDERVDGYIVAGAGIIISAVALTTTAKVKIRSDARERQPELPAVESTG